MPTADGRFKGIVVPELSWLRDKAEIAGRKQVCPAHRSTFTAAHMADGETRFNPDGYEIFDRHGKQLNGFTTEPVGKDKQLSDREP